MSLIITRNNGSDPPESYHNYFKDTFIVKPHSQIAVHTCVINRDPSYVLTEPSRFYIYHGSYTVNELKLALNYPNLTGYDLWVDQPIEVLLAKGRYGVDTMAEHVQTQLNYYDHHPSFQGKWTCVVQRDSNGQFTGYTIKATQRGLDAASKPSSIGVMPRNSGAQLGLTVDTSSANITFTCSGNSLQGNLIKHPLNAAGGEVVWDMNSVQGQWKLGLRRYSFDNAYTDPDTDHLTFDFLLEQEGGVLKVYQSLYETDPISSSMTSLEHDYRDEHSTGPFHSYYDWTQNNQLYRFIKFRLENQKVSIWAAPVDGAGSGPGTFVLITNTSKAVGYSTYALFPFVMLQKNTSVATLHSMNLVPGYSTTRVDNASSSSIVNSTSLYFEKSDAMSQYEKGAVGQPFAVPNMTRRTITGDRLNSETVLVVDATHISSKPYAFPQHKAPDVGHLLGFEADDVVTPAKPSTLVESFVSDAVPAMNSDVNSWGKKCVLLFALNMIGFNEELQGNSCHCSFVNCCSARDS